MNLMEAIYSRRSVRHFTDKTVDKAVIEKLMDAAIQAPSASNSQPWSFAVIQDSETLKRYSDMAKAHLLKMATMQPALERYRTMLSNAEYNVFYNSGTLVIIYARPEGPHPEGDCCLAAQNLMLAAHDLGLGSCWIGLAVSLLNTPEIKAELGVPKEYTAIAPIIIGYPHGKIPQLMRTQPEIIFWR
jgi:nitroreductase